MGRTVTKASKQRQRERAAQRKAERERARRRRRLRSYGIVALVVVLLGGAITAAVIADRRGEDIDGLQVYRSLSREHTEDPVVYDEVPPVGGAHSATPLTCGIYSEPVPDENAVHSLEHGAVWITHQPDLDQDEVESLRAFVRAQSPIDQQHLLLSPYEGIPGPVVVSAWGRQVVLDGATDPRLGEFVDTFLRGPQAPEAGQPCQGVGTPDA